MFLTARAVSEIITALKRLTLCYDDDASAARFPDRRTAFHSQAAKDTDRFPERKS
jgi:hypothetical protein